MPNSLNNSYQSQRYAAGLTRRELATLVGISLTDVIEIENGKKIPDSATEEQLRSVFKLFSN